MARLRYDYGYLFQQIKPYVSFSLSKKRKPTNSQKRKVLHYFKELFGGKDAGGDYVPGLANQPHRFVRTKSKATRKALETYSQQPRLKGLKGVFVPVDDDSRPTRITVRKGVVELEQNNVTSKAYLFKDFEEYAGEVEEDWERVIKRMAREIRKESKKTKYFIITGRRRSRSSYSRNLALAKIREWIEEYESAPKWLLGLEAKTFKRQADFKTLQKRRGKAREAKKARVAALKKKAKVSRRKGKR